jgi:hypothetical protein
MIVGDFLKIEKRIVRFITRTNWILLVLVGVTGFALTSPAFAKGMVLGGLIVTINFHLLSRTLNRSLKPPYLASPNVILAKYYIRFIISGVIIFFLITQQVVNPLGLIVGLSVVVASMMLAALLEITKLRVKEAV